MPGTAEKRLRIAAARADFLSFGHAASEVVPGIVTASWLRSSSAGVDAATSQAIYHHDLDLTGRLMRCAQPVIERLSGDMAQMPLSIVLTDYKARVLSRSETDKTIGTLLDKVSLAPGFNYAESLVGTNGIGTVLESGQPLYLVGPEHFHEQLQPFACAGSPIKDPLTGRLEGVLDISCLSEYSSPLMGSLVRSAAHEIERNLLVDRNLRQQILFETFIRVESHTRGAVLAIGGTMNMANVVAQNLLDPVEQVAIHEHARYLMICRGNPVDTIELASGKTVHLRGTRVTLGEDVTGIVVIVDIVSEGARALAPKPGLRAGLSPHTPSASDSGEPVQEHPSGRSLLWKRARTGVSEAFAGNRPVLIIGEAGSGKSFLAQDVFEQLSPLGQSIIVPCDVLDQTVLDRTVLDRTVLDRTVLDDSLPAGTPVLCVFTHLERLSVTGVAIVHDYLTSLRTRNSAVTIAATVSIDQLDIELPYRALLADFDASVTVAPLRHRMEDLPLLVALLLQKLTGRRSATVSASAMRTIARYAWPRNVTELTEALEAALVRRPVGEIAAEDLPGYCHGGSPRLLSAIESGERDLIVTALNEAEGNRMQAAQALGIARSSLYRKLKSFGLSAV
jgi:transcriptional regulator of acetoin/glycerol metabolism